MGQWTPINKKHELLIDTLPPNVQLSHLADPVFAQFSLFARFGVFLLFLFSDDGRLHGATARKRLGDPRFFFAYPGTRRELRRTEKKPVAFRGFFSRESENSKR